MVGWYCSAKIKGEGFVDILQGWRGWHCIRDAEAETLRLSGTVVGILANDDDLCPCKRRQRKRAKFHPGWRINRSVCTLIGEAVLERLAIWSRKDWRENGVPV
jgi:hypothetical protein